MDLHTEKTARLLEMAAPYNPRQITDEELAKLQRSLRYFGIVQPIIVNTRSGHVVGGHQRVKAAQAEGIDDMPVVRVDLDEPSEKQLNLALNRISGTWDTDALAVLLADLEKSGADMDLTGFDDSEIQKLLDEISRPEVVDTEPQTDRAEELREQWGTARGQLWTMGDHRLLCGDSTDAGDVERCLGGDKPLLMVTDPPYGVEYDPAWRNEAAAKGQLAYAGRRVGTVVADDRADWTDAWKLSPVDVVYAWSAAGRLSIDAALSLESAGFEIRNQIIWKKAHFPISRGHYTYQHEPCWYGVRKGRTAHWCGDKSASSVWEVSLDKNVDGGHSTQKPLECMARPIRNHDSEFVYEPFLGSGTTLIACEQLGRKCRAIEISPAYVAVALQRYQDTTGITPELAK